jgi:hypothetical protein
VIRLALRLSVGGGREQLARLAVLSLGVGLGAGLLLFATAVFPAIHGHEARDAWTTTSAHNSRPSQDESGSDALLWLARVDGYAGRDIQRIDVAALGPRAPLPPGLTRLPAAGELAVSPALRRLLATTPRDELADRYPGRIVATVGPAALRSPDALVVFVGVDPAQLATQPNVERVRSIETQPRSVSLTRFGRVVVGLGSAALLVPILVLIGTATRLAAARREQRLAAMRLVGATPGQIRALAVIEALLGALAGTVLGFIGFAVARPYAARFPVDGATFFPADLRPSAWAAALVGLGVPTLAATAALLALRRVQVSPLGVTRQAVPGRPGLLRLVPLAAGLAGFAGSLPALANAKGEAPVWAIAGTLGLIIVGIVVAGPWLTLAVGRLLTVVSRHPSTLLAGNRLIHNPTAGFRSISGLVLAVFLGTIVAEAGASALARSPEPGHVPVPAATVGAAFLGDGVGPLPADRAGELVARLRGSAGVTGVLDLRWTGSSAPTDHADTLPVVVRCADLRTTGLATCPDPAATVGLDAGLLRSGVVRSIGGPGADTDFARLPLVGLLVTTDGRRATREAARTTIETATGETTLPWTTDELKGRNTAQSDRLTWLSDTALLVTLLIAGLSLAIAATGGLLERKRPFALLRLAGARPSDLRRALLAETAAPLLSTAVASAALGLSVSAEIFRVTHQPWRPPLPGYWWMLASGLAVAVAIAVAATIPLLGRLTAPETARVE